MSASGRTEPAPLIWSLALLAVAIAELVLQEGYFRFATSSIGLLALMASAVFVTVADAWVRRFAREPRAKLLQRLLFVFSALVAGYWLIGPHLAGLWERHPQAAPWAAGAGLLMILVLSLRFAADGWARLRLALCVASFLFVASEPVLGALRAKDGVWPPGFQANDAVVDAGRVATIVFLLDELNARNSTPIIEVLRRQGLQVAIKAVPSIGDSTARVLPSMFTGQLFHDARPCGLKTICSANQALDFSRISATRPDVDVVGFYHPYCAIKGLRTCVRPAVELAVFSLSRWQCGLWRRFGLPLGVDASSCRATGVGVWGSLTDRVLAGVSQSPALTVGGVLFAHLPLPHPPGHSDDGALAQHYDANLLRAAAAVEQTLKKAAGNGLALRVVIFSDHPLRQPAWCRGYPGLFTGPCAPVDRLLDDKVPLIVAGATTPDLSTHSTNLNAFALMAGWLGQAVAR